MPPKLTVVPLINLLPVIVRVKAAPPTVALAGVAPVPWLLESSLDDATPLPGTAYKVQIAKALVERARAAVA